ncbi:MAG: hypothetical protein K0R82_2918, partial [Flavipsychrobacter sp.]|nr:hypothetical protein [Flavipsychrobacter sp.]
MSKILYQVYWHNSIRDWSTALIILVCFFIAARFLKALIVKRIKGFAQRSATVWDDFLIVQIESSLLPVAY